MTGEDGIAEIFKGFIEALIKGSWEIVSSNSKTKRRERMLNLSRDLKRIADLINRANTRLKNKEIPSDESIQLDIVISYATDLATPFKKKHPKLAEVFDSLLPDIARQMQLADYIIEGKIRGNAVLTNDNKNIILRFTPEDQLKIANKELTKAATIIEEHSRKFESLGE